MIVFKSYDKYNKLDMFNKELSKNSKGRFELRKSKNDIYYLYDYDFREVTRNKKELRDILECMHLYTRFEEEL